MSDTHSKAKSIFLDALEKPPSERDTFVAAACGVDTQLRSRVLRILEIWSEEDPDEDFTLTSPFDGSDSNSNEDEVRSATVPEKSGSKIGPYRLVKKVGEGGMGVVFLAEQDHPVRREVALKIIKPGMDSKEVIARFEVERRAIAMMDHPNIARVYDAGTTDQGRLFFVMELVRGIPICRYCDEHQLTVSERLELFVEVCHAIQHAHQKGIVHRDIKPSNILVHDSDGRLVVKVIDFGIAKATGEQLTDYSMATQLGQVIGTVEYMSPEQADIEKIDIDTRSDVFSLGVLLFELLTGSTPLQRETLKASSYEDALRRIREEDPPRPSSRLKQLGESLNAVAAQRRVDPRRLIGMVRGDLDWIALQALEKDRSRRYETANGLSRDIQRHLSLDPVEACPPSNAYRVKKFVNKHRAAISVLSAFIVLLIISLVTSLWQANQVRNQRDAAVEAEDEANQARANTVDALDAVRRAKDETDAALEAAQVNERVANQLRDRAEQLLESAEQSAYAGQVVATQYALEQGVNYPQEFWLCRWDLRGWEHDYLAKLGSVDSYARLDHGGRITSIEVSPEGSHVAVGGADGVISIWRLAPEAESELIVSLNGHEGTVSSLDFSTDGDRIVSGGYDASVKVWDVVSGECVETFTGHGARVRSVAISADGTRVVSGGGDNTVRIWSIETGEPIETLMGHRGEVRGVAISPDGKTIASGSADETIKLWDAESAELQRTITGHNGAVASVALDDSGHVLSGSWDKSVKLWERSTGELVQDFQGHSNLVMAVAFMGDGERIVSGGWDGRLRFWDIDSGEETHHYKVESSIVDISPNVKEGLVAIAEWNVQTRVFEDRPTESLFAGHDRRVSALAISPDNREVVTADSGGTLKVWDIKTYQERTTIESGPAEVFSIAFSPDGKRVISSNIRFETSVWDLESGDKIKQLRGFCVSPDGSAAIDFRDGRLRLIDIESEEERFSIEHTPKLPNVAPGVAFSRDGSKVAFASIDILVLDTETGEVLSWMNNDNQVTDLTFDVTGDRVISVGGAGLMKVWDCSSSELIDAYETVAVKIRLNPAGDRIFVGSGMDGAGSIEVWNAESFTRITRLKKHEATVAALGMTSDGKYLVSGSMDHDARVWDGSGSINEFVRNEHRMMVTGVGISMTGDRMVSASWDGMVKVWDSRMGRHLLDFEQHDAPLVGATITSDGKWCVTRGLDGRVLVWDSGTGEVEHALQLSDGATDTEKMRLRAVAVDLSGTRVLCAHGDRRATFWDLADSLQEPALELETGVVTAMAVARDGKRFAIADAESNVIVYAVDSGSEVGKFKSEGDIVGGLAFDDSGTKLVCISIVGELLAWDLETLELIHQFDGHAIAESAGILGETSAIESHRENDFPARGIVFKGDGYRHIEALNGVIYYDEVTGEEILKQAEK